MGNGADLRDDQNVTFRDGFVEAEVRRRKPAARRSPLMPAALSESVLSPSETQYDIHLSAPHQRPRRRSGAAQPFDAVWLIPGLRLCADAAGVTGEVRIVRRSAARRLDENPHRSGRSDPPVCISSDAEQPCLIVNDLRLEPREGLMALWISPGTQAYFFSGLKVTAENRGKRSTSIRPTANSVRSTEMRELNHLGYTLETA